MKNNEIVWLKIEYSPGCYYYSTKEDFENTEKMLKSFWDEFDSKVWFGEVENKK